MVELVIAVALLGVLFMVLHSGEIALRKTARSLESRARAIFSAQEYLEMTCAALPTTGPRQWTSQVAHGEGQMKGTLDVRPCPQAPTMRSVTLTVVWTDVTGGPAHTLVLSRLVQDRVTP